MRFARLIFIDEPPLNALPPLAILELIPISFSQLRKAVENSLTSEHTSYEICNYIKHEPTIYLLNKELGLNLTIKDQPYQYKEGDKILLITPKNPNKENITKNDLLIYYVVVR